MLMKPEKVYLLQVCGKWQTGKMVDNYTNMDDDDDDGDGEMMI